MPDVHDKATRSRNMAAVRSKNTQPELALRRALHARGYRFRLYRKDLPGKPDLVFPGRRAVIFVNGCFWHGHNCRAGALPATRRSFWKPKIEQNRQRDARNIEALLTLGWRVLTIWECDLKDPAAIEQTSAWLDISQS